MLLFSKRLASNVPLPISCMLLYHAVRTCFPSFLLVGDCGGICVPVLLVPNISTFVARTPQMKRLTSSDASAPMSVLLQMARWAQSDCTHHLPHFPSSFALWSPSVAGGQNKYLGWGTAFQLTSHQKKPPQTFCTLSISDPKIFFSLPGDPEKNSNSLRTSDGDLNSRNPIQFLWRLQ